MNGAYRLTGLNLATYSYASRPLQNLQTNVLLWLFLIPKDRCVSILKHSADIIKIGNLTNYSASYSAEAKGAVVADRRSHEFATRSPTKPVERSIPVVLFTKTVKLCSQYAPKTFRMSREEMESISEGEVTMQSDSEWLLGHNVKWQAQAKARETWLDWRPTSTDSVSPKWRV